jgi:hypothetical protein
MTVFMLVLVNLLLVLGMTYLPSVSGSGVGSIVTRAWLALGFLIFLGHYYYYLEEKEKEKNRKAAAAFKAHRRLLRSGERSAAHK